MNRTQPDDTHCCCVLHAACVALQTLRPLCASVFKALSERGSSESVGNAMSHLLEESHKLRAKYFLPLLGTAAAGTTAAAAAAAATNNVVHCLDQETRTMVLKRMQALAQASFEQGSVDGQKAAVVALGDALLRAQQQAYRYTLCTIAAPLYRNMHCYCSCSKDS
jgi:uncharacterized tellurite resistance protein B-like protein